MEWGFWQCKLRYQTQQELLDVAREYKKRNIPIDVIVVDYFHCPNREIGILIQIIGLIQRQW